MNAQTHTLALDFLGLRRRGIAAKPAALMTARFHGVPEIRVLSAYELFEYSAGAAS
jgi:hypothetical protein